MLDVSVKMKGVGARQPEVLYKQAEDQVSHSPRAQAGSKSMSLLVVGDTMVLLCVVLRDAEYYPYVIATSYNYTEILDET